MKKLCQHKFMKKLLILLFVTLFIKIILRVKIIEKWWNGRRRDLVSNQIIINNKKL